MGEAMAFTARRIRVAARVVASVSLFVGLANVLRAFGTFGDAFNPVEQFGQFGFSILLVTGLLRLFAAVGLWAYATWGAALLILASVIELVLLFLAITNVVISGLGVGLSVLLLGAGVGLLVWRYVNARHHAAAG